MYTKPNNSNAATKRQPSNIYFLEVPVMKKTFTYLMIFVSWTLMPGLGGCADHRSASDEQPTTQPPPVSTQPTCQTAEPGADETVEAVSDRSERVRQMDRMTHNAELADMSLSDIHFMPNRSILNSNGTQRLTHLAWIVDHYGGTIMLDLEDSVGPMAKERMQTVVAYLKACGLVENKILVEFGLPQTKGMGAKEAVNIYNDTRYKPKDSGKGDAKSVTLNGSGSCGQ